MVLTPKNWNSFQHYKGRSPPWIKLHRSLLDDYDFSRLPLASRALAPLLWLLASEYEGGHITASPGEIAFRLRISYEALKEALSPLIDNGFFIASEMLAERLQDACLEKEREKQVTSNKKEEDSEAVASADVVGEEPKARLFRIGKTILVSFGIAEKRTGALIGQWLKTRNDPAGLLAAIQFARDQNVAEPIAYISAVIAKEKSNGNGKQSLVDLAFELAEQARERERAAGIFRPPDIVGSH